MKHTITVSGKSGKWSVEVPPKLAALLAADGIPVDTVHNSVPEWVVDAGLVRVWCAAQDAWAAPMRLIAWIKGARHG